MSALLTTEWLGVAEIAKKLSAHICPPFALPLQLAQQKSSHSLPPSQDMVVIAANGHQQADTSEQRATIKGHHYGSP